MSKMLEIEYKSMLTEKEYDQLIQHYQLEPKILPSKQIFILIHLIFNWRKKLWAAYPPFRYICRIYVKNS